MKICTECRWCVLQTDMSSGVDRPRCLKAPDLLADGGLCGEMRKGACGPDATLWEARDG